MNSTVPTVARLDLMTVEDHMHAGVLGCDPSAPVSTVAWILADEQIHCVIVFGLDRTADGMRLTWGAVTDRDVMRALADADSSRCAADIASEGVVMVEVDEPLLRAAELMSERDVTHLVVTENGFPVGIISSLDVARAAAG